MPTILKALSLKLPYSLAALKASLANTRRESLTHFQVAEQNNFAISEFINNKKAESNYEPIKNKVAKGSQAT